MKRFLFILLFLFILSNNLILAQSNISKNQEITDLNKEEAISLIKQGNWDFPNTDWKNYFINNQFVVIFNSLMEKISFIFNFIIGVSYSFTLAFFLILLLWIFLFGQANKLITLSGLFNPFVSFLVSLAFFSLLANLGFFTEILFQFGNLFHFSSDVVSSSVVTGKQNFFLSFFSWFFFIIFILIILFVISILFFLINSFVSANQRYYRKKISERSKIVYERMKQGMISIFGGDIGNKEFYDDLESYNKSYEKNDDNSKSPSPGDSDSGNGGSKHGLQFDNRQPYTEEELNRFDLPKNKTSNSGDSGNENPGPNRIKLNDNQKIPRLFKPEKYNPKPVINLDSTNSSTQKVKYSGSNYKNRGKLPSTYSKAPSKQRAPLNTRRIPGNLKRPNYNLKTKGGFENVSGRKGQRSQGAKVKRNRSGRK